MDRVPLVRLRVCGQDASLHEFETGFLHPVDQFIRRGTVCPAEMATTLRMCDNGAGQCLNSSVAIKED